MRRNNPLRTIFLVVGGVLLITLVLVGAVEYTSRSGFCRTCHEMEPIYASWQSSAHKNVECIKCHSDPGVVGLIKTKTKALKEVYSHITGNYKTPITITSDTGAFTARCLRCHQNIKAKGKPHNKLHFASNINCMECHRGLVHNPNTNKTPPGRGVCVKCHGQEITG